MALVSSDYRVYWLASDCVTCIGGLTDTGRLDTLAGFNIEVTDNLNIGDAGFRWSAADPNAEAMIIDLPVGDAEEVPLLIVGQAIEAVNLGWFNGYTETNIAVVDLAKTSWAAFGFSAAGVPRIRAGGVASVIAFNDAGIAIGTVLTTAETKVTVAFDETLTGVGAFHIGTSGVPQILNANPGATVMPMSLHVKHSAGAGDMDDYVGFYNKLDMIGAGDATVTAVVDASRAYVGLTGGANNTVVKEMYACQPWAKHEGTGALTAMSALSAKLDVSADAFTVSTINAGHFHVEGAATVTSTMFDAVMIEIYPDVTCLDAGLRIAVDTGAVVADGIAFIGVMSDGIDMSGATLTRDIVLHHGGTIVNTAGVTTITDTTIDLVGALIVDGVTVSGAIGMADDQVLTLGTTTATAATKITVEFDETTTGIGSLMIGSLAVPQVLNVDPGATVVPVVINVNHTAGPGTMDDYVGLYDRINIIGTGDATVTAVAAAFRAYVGDDATSDAVVAQLYAIQPWVRHGGTGAITAMSAVSAMCDVTTNAFTASTVNSGHFHVQGAATVTAQFDGVMIEIYPDVTCLDAGLAIASDSGAVVDSGIRLAGTFVHDIKLSSGAYIMTGTADPNGAVSASDGSIYLRTGTGAYATVLYVCKGTTEWDAVAVTP